MQTDEPAYSNNNVECYKCKIRMIQKVQTWFIPIPVETPIPLFLFLNISLCILMELHVS